MPLPAINRDSVNQALAVFGHVQKLAAIFVNVGYLKMIVRLSSYDIVEVARLSRDFNLYDIVSFSPDNLSEVVCHRTTIVRLSSDCRTMSYDLPTIYLFPRHDRCAANPSFPVSPQN